MNAPLHQRSQLYNVEIEAALIGAVMTNNGLMASACSDLYPEHFFEGPLAEIFSAARDMISKGGTADARSLISYFQTNPNFQAIGGNAFFAGLAANAAPAIAAPQYARIIRDLFIRRRMVEEAESAITEIESLPVDETGSDYAADLSQRLADLAAAGITKKTRFSFEESITTAVDQIASAYQFEGRRPDAVASGLKSLDNLIGGFILGDLVVIAGRPSMGKTAVAIEIARRAAQRGIPTDFHSLEMAAWQLSIRALSASMAIPKVAYQRLMWGKFGDSEWQNVIETARTIQGWPLTIIDQDRVTLPTIRAELARSKAKRPDTKIVVLDYLGLIQGSGKANGNRAQEVGEITAELKRMAKQFQVVMIVLSQLSRGVEQRENKRPQMSDLRESGSVEQDADLIIFPFREEYYVARDEPPPNTKEHFEWQDRMTALDGVMELIVSKNRQGRSGTVKIKAEMSTNTFIDVENEQTEMF